MKLLFTLSKDLKQSEAFSRLRRIIFPIEAFSTLDIYKIIWDLNGLNAS